jgi:hypothetical protein
MKPPSPSSPTPKSPKDKSPKKGLLSQYAEKHKNTKIMVSLKKPDEEEKPFSSDVKDKSVAAAKRIPAVIAASKKQVIPSALVQTSAKSKKSSVLEEVEKKFSFDKKEVEKEEDSESDGENCSDDSSSSCKSTSEESVKKKRRVKDAVEDKKKHRRSSAETYVQRENFIDRRARNNQRGPGLNRKHDDHQRRSYQDKRGAERSDNRRKPPFQRSYQKPRHDLRETRRSDDHGYHNRHARSKSPSRARDSDRRSHRSRSPRRSKSVVGKDARSNNIHERQSPVPQANITKLIRKRSRPETVEPETVRSSLLYDLKKIRVADV